MKPNIQYGRMRHAVALAGVHGMRLERGQCVKLVEPTNLPASDHVKWFASPVAGEWSDGVERDRWDAILIDHDDVDIEESRPDAWFPPAGN